MTIDDKIRDAEPHYYINRKVTKLSDLSSDKIDKYEYITKEEMLSLGQCRIIEQANFTYFLLRKDFEKQIKTIKNQIIWKKQTKAIEEHGKGLAESNALIKLRYNYDANILLRKKKQSIFETKNINFVDEKRGEILKLSKKINYNNLTYDYKGKKIGDKNLKNFDHAFGFLKNKTVI